MRDCTLICAMCSMLDMCIWVFIHTIVILGFVLRFFFSLAFTYFISSRLLCSANTFSVSLLFSTNTFVALTVLYFCFHSASTTTLSEIVGGSHIYMCVARVEHYILTKTNRETNFNVFFAFRELFFRRIFVSNKRTNFTLTE